jgi:hypothetical protein
MNKEHIMGVPCPSVMSVSQKDCIAISQWPYDLFAALYQWLYEVFDTGISIL